MSDEVPELLDALRDGLEMQNTIFDAMIESLDKLRALYGEMEVGNDQ